MIDPAPRSALFSSAIRRRAIDGAAGFVDGLAMDMRLARRSFLLLLLLLSWATTGRAGAPFSYDTTPGKLPKNVYPENYAIHLQPDLKSLTTSGSALIDIHVLKPVQEIVLNSLDLEITRAALSKDRSASPDVTKGWLALSPKLETNAQILILHLPQRLAAGRYRLLLEFTGRIREQEQGLFYIRYNSSSGQKTMLATQMEATDARRMFPCWDEPVFRSRFDLQVVLPAQFKAVSNMPIQRETPLGGGLKETDFRRTPSMASYLVVLVAGELEELTDKAQGVEIHVITTEGKREQGRFALDATKALLGYYNDYFGIKYPLPKLDQIAIPGGFDGAMENWGGIVYNENTLLFDPKTSSEKTRHDIFVTVAHEMAHQWFGDLVTMAWWDNLWLNEGFATWMETKATDHFHPDWQMWLSAASEKSGAMSADARSTTHPVQEPVNTEGDANDAFDDITYQKGGAFLHMFEDYLGAEDFRRGIHRYLSTHRYSNATTRDLWNALENASGKPVRAIAPAWTEQPGLPVVNVRADCSSGVQTIQLEQERFTVHNSNAEALHWSIPLALLKLDPKPSVSHLLLSNKTGSIKFPNCETPVLANARGAGYYRTAYDAALFQRILAQLNELGPGDRLTLLQDSWAMTQGNRGSITNFFALAALLRQEPNYAIWEQILGVIAFLDNLQPAGHDRDAFREYSRWLVMPQFRRLGWTAAPNESANDLLLRDNIIRSLGRLGDPSVIAEAQNRFAAFLSTPLSLPAELRKPVFEIAGEYADGKTYDALHNLARQAAGSEQRELCYGSMSRARDPELARATLAIALTDETVPSEAAGLVQQVARNQINRDLALEFARSHLDQLLNKVSSYERSTYLPSLYAAYSDESHARELDDYIKSENSDDAVTKGREILEEIRFKIAFKNRVLPEVRAWLKSSLPSNPKSTSNDAMKIEKLNTTDGATPKAREKVTVHYTGWLTNGVKFDSSVDRDDPFTFVLGAGQVIKGWDEGVAQLRVGEKARFTIPPEKAYGEAGFPGAIPPNATLIFEVELLEIH